MSAQLNRTNHFQWLARSADISSVKQTFGHASHTWQATTQSNTPAQILVYLHGLWQSVTYLQLLFLVAVPLCSRVLSTLLFRYRLSLGTEGNRPIPLAPYWVPALFHLVPFLLQTSAFPVRIIKQYGWKTPIMIRAATVRLVIIANPDHVVTAFRSRFMSARSITERSTRYLLDIPSSLIPFYQADDSGMAAEPRKGSTVEAHNRILYHQTHNHQKWMASPQLEPLIQCFTDVLHRNFETLEIGEEWIEYPDLFEFLQTVVRTNIETLMGSKILELNPHLVQDFCRAKEYAPGFFRGLPRWLIQEGFKARERVVNAIMKWHEYALANGDHTNIGTSEPYWDSIWGSQYAKARQQYMLKMEPFTANVRAREDWGFLFGLNANTHSAVFWYLFAPLRDPALLNRMMTEVEAARRPDGSIDAHGLEKQHLLQSVFSETLRLRLSIMVSRVVEWAPFKFAGYTIPPGDFVLMPTDSVHYSEEAWERVGRRSKVPLNDFDADRFLVPSASGPEYSLDGLAGLWIPFGGGDRMCPGRHLAKLEMLYAFAYLFSTYEFDVDSSDMSRVSADSRFAPFGVLPPNKTVRFKIRRKAQK